MTTSDRQPSDQHPNAVIFDVDGTLCDVRSVRHFVQGFEGKKRAKADFDKFHQGSAKCPPFDDVKRLSRRAHDLGLCILVVTGREAKWASLTESWLDRNAIPWDGLRMRQANDYRPDHVIKAEIQIEIASRFEAILAVDDRPDTINVWRAAKIPTLRVEVTGKVTRMEPPTGVVLHPLALTLLAEGAL